MRLDAKRERELSRRSGFARRTILAVVWLAISFGLAYLVVTMLIDNELLTYNFVYNRLFVPREIPTTAILIGLMVVVVIIMNFFVLVGYALVSPVGRRRPGTPSMYSQDPDPDDQKYNYR